MFKSIAKAQISLLTLMLTVASIVQAEDKELDAKRAKEGQEQDPQGKFTIFGLPLLATDGSLTVGLGAAASDSPIKGIGCKNGLFPQITFQNGNFFVDTGLLGYSVYSNDLWRCTLLGNLSLSEYDVDDSTYLKGIKEQDAAHSNSPTLELSF